MYVVTVPVDITLNNRLSKSSYRTCTVYCLFRIHASGVPSPLPVVLKSHVLVMSFIGEDGWYVTRLHGYSPSDLLLL